MDSVMTQKLMMMAAVTGAAASRGRLMFYLSAQLLCVNATLNYLVVFWVWEMHPALAEGGVGPLRTERKRQKDRKSKTFSENCPRLSQSPSLFPSRLFGAA